MFEITRLRIRRLARWESSFIKILGTVEIILGLMLILPILVALIQGEDYAIFIYPIPFLLGLGIFQHIMFKSNEMMSPTLGILMMAFGWGVSFVVSAIPFYLYGFSFVDSLFEGVSGFTTTGASIVTDVESLPDSLLLWRSFIQWAGGIAIVIVFMFLLPLLGIGGRTFINNELSGSASDNFSMRMKSAARSFIAIYAVLTIAEIFLLMLCNVNVFESVCMTFSTVSTGGLMVKGDSLASYSVLVQGVVLIFMFLGGTNFFLHYRALYKRDFKAYIKNQEFIWTIIIFIIATITISIIVITGLNFDNIETDNAASTVWQVLFTVVSIGTSTGFTVVDHSTLWPTAAIAISLCIGMIGAMSGSTAGGVKIYRLLIVKSYITNGIYKVLNPNAVKEVKLNGYTVNNDTVSSSIVVVLLFLLTGITAFIILFILEPGIDFSTSLGLTVASLGNMGIGLGEFGPSGSFAGLSDASKVFLSFIMWVGRLEVIMALVLFTRSFWKEIAITAQNNSSKVHVEREYLKKSLKRIKK